MFKIVKDRIFVDRIEFDKTGWSYPWNSDKNCTQNSARGSWGEGVVGWGPRGSRESGVRGGSGLGFVWVVGDLGF